MHGLREGEIERRSDNFPAEVTRREIDSVRYEMVIRHGPSLGDPPTARRADISA